MIHTYIYVCVYVCIYLYIYLSFYGLMVRSCLCSLSRLPRVGRSVQVVEGLVVFVAKELTLDPELQSLNPQETPEEYPKPFTPKP